ncbi:MAG TPA: diguanylate cyclase [Spirochaetia bacterium]|nr:diguanylate cyclase [Spirochaetia bacterium]
MIALDMRTVISSYTISNFICMIVIAVLWGQNRRRFAGVGFWLGNFILQFAGLSLFALRGITPPVYSIMISNPLFIGGTALLYEGLGRFIGKPGRRLVPYFILAGYMIIHTYFTFGSPSLAARTILFSGALMIVSMQCAWLLFSDPNSEQRSATAGAGYVFIAFSIASAIRIAVELLTPPRENFFRSNVYETLILVCYQMLYIILTFTLSLMVNRRLFFTIEKDIIARRQTEEALRQSEKKFSKAFQSSPDAIIISRLEDGRFVEANDGFCRLTGYSHEEILSATSLSLSLWVNPDNRREIVAELKKNSHVANMKIDFRIKSGKILNCLYSGELITLGDEACILSVVRDISQREQAEKIVRLRLELWEFATAHSMKELMQKALDEIEELTDSLIGFYHFVQEDQGTLTLQAWSTRTRATYCKAEGEGMHYPIVQAGVWTDCLSERKPVIHNDYASLPHRKGLPAGHAPLIRELVVPTMREGRIVSVLGVGNKPAEYNEQDVVLVTYIADLVWTIVTQKRTDEEIQRLNAQLTHLAMTDELTGLENRRSFFIQGEEEIRRCRRYRTVLSLIMFDLDSFKDVNDTYGHDVGDTVLKCITSALLKKIRDVDIAARLGGEEFGILLPNTTAAAAVSLAERLRLAIEEEICLEKDQQIRVTASIGVASYDGNADAPDLEHLLRDADIAMYHAKRRGKNRVVHLGGPGTG